MPGHNPDQELPSVALISQLEPLLEAIKEYDEEITRLFRSHPASSDFRQPPRCRHPAGAAGGFRGGVIEKRPLRIG